jgi:hypothetical protein
MVLILWVKTLCYECNFRRKDLIRKLVKIIYSRSASTIGRQMEFYQENKRVLPVEIDYPHYYTRTLKKITKRSLSKNQTNLIWILKPI